ncbi:hypothetical protein [Desertivirga brevis]|uniref:hypothetical protein n=1 Tax=Desertivirga brevis TaxID=2810310 RepID=UPI001A95E1E8|nr:hypothetical protein [Pedobacter sp. SYSU D00873]
MRVLLTKVLIMFSLLSFSQQKITTASISHYVNSELYLKGGIVTYLADKAGNPAPGGKYVTIYNSSGQPVYYNSVNGGRSLRELKPNQKVIVPVKNERQAKAVKFILKYSADENNFSQRVPALSSMNAETERNLRTTGQSKNLPNKSIQATISSKPASVQLPVKPAAKVALTWKAPANRQASRKTKIIPKAAPSKPVINSGPFNCLYAPQPAYYTFYFLKTGKEVLFSDPFAVGSYSNEDVASEMLDEALTCLEERLKKKFDEKKFEKLLTDPNKGLEMGMMHLQHTSMSSAEVRARYPYTASKILALKELSKWIMLERKNHPGLTFVKI